MLGDRFPLDLDFRLKVGGEFETAFTSRLHKARLHSRVPAQARLFRSWWLLSIQSVLLIKARLGGDANRDPRAWTDAVPSLPARIRVLSLRRNCP
jgi:hypothetical protein